MAGIDMGLAKWVMDIIPDQVRGFGISSKEKIDRDRPFLSTAAALSNATPKANDYDVIECS
ncbi:C6 zinc finger domain protein [Aspergillus luchuensis]|uniref:C6 zinc finger domain protein n=1 Tax=Aspergillus kawachii TaxID=1069201 RepID=A0A146F2Z7_ASPKA|nr:C6 zinc finger domain protein [Aspergillus luchuensis]